MKKYLLLLIPILFLNLGFALDLSLVNPHTNHTYPHSVGIPLDFAAEDTNGTCYYVVSECTLNKFGDQICTDTEPHHIVTNCDTNTTFGLIYDGEYTLQLFADNDTTSKNVNSTFYVSRSTEFEEGKPLLMGLIIMLFFGIFVVFLFVTKAIKEETPAFTLITGFISLLSLLTALYLSAAAIEEYIKSPAMARIVGSYTWLLMLLAVFLAFYGLILLIVYILNYLRSRKLKV